MPGRWDARTNVCLQPKAVQMMPCRSGSEQISCCLEVISRSNPMLDVKIKQLSAEKRGFQRKREKLIIRTSHVSPASAWILLCQATLEGPAGARPEGLSALGNGLILQGKQPAAHVTSPCGANVRNLVQ